MYLTIFSILEGGVFVNVAFAVVGFRRKHYADGVGREVAKFAPHARRNKNAFLGRRQMVGLFVRAIIYPNIKTAIDRENDFGTGGVGMSAARLAIGHTINPEHALDGEGQLSAFCKAERTAFVGVEWHCDELATK